MRGGLVDALKVFDVMASKQGEANGLQPNEVPSWQFYQLVQVPMSCEFGLVAKMEHYGFMKKMPFEADATFLGDLMGACRLHGAIELGNGGDMCTLKHLCWRREVESHRFLKKSKVRCWNTEGSGPQFYLIELITVAAFICKIVNEPAW
ncbi:hypothetical protein H5410_000591 [Solanum commersonii]|uniref:Pentatricopeptide repeat-containing protein n=1 Tax=Solanum commersonii TaxID=4109 RepID=A0A9J6AX72_SOLCO|nr:hypothetical protein H5410_000591 [Solanum commersonii]